MTSGTSYKALVAKAEALRKQQPKLTKEQAFTKTLTDPVNRELAQAERAERRERAMAG